MTMLTDYTPQQAMFDRAFSSQASCCSVTCKACGRTYFVTSPGHGSYEEGELEQLRELAAADPEKVIEVPDYAHVAMAHVEGQQIVIGCSCDPTDRITKWIEGHAEELTEYLKLYWAAARERARHDADVATSALEDLV